MREAGNLIALLEQSPGETVKSSHLLAPHSSALLPPSSLPAPSLSRLVISVFILSLLYAKQE